MIGGLISICSGETSPIELKNLRVTWGEANERDAKPIKKKYVAALETLRTQLTQRGDLEGAIVVRDEIEALTKDGKRPEAKAGVPDKFISLQHTYERELKRVMGWNQKKYRTALEALQNRFKKKGDLEGALAIKRELAELPVRDPGSEWMDLVAMKPQKISDHRSFTIRINSEEPQEFKGKELSAREFIYAHAPGEIEFHFNQAVTEFQATIALVDGEEGEVAFIVNTEHGEVFRSEGIRSKSKNKEVEIKFKPSRTLTLTTDKFGSGLGDHSCWLFPKCR